MIKANETNQISLYFLCLKSVTSVIHKKILSSQCVNHNVAFTNINTLDKCLDCVGPVSSLKWLGYKCKGRILFSVAKCAKITYYRCIVCIYLLIISYLQNAQESGINLAIHG